MLTRPKLNNKGVTGQKVKSLRFGIRTKVLLLLSSLLLLIFGILTLIFVQTNIRSLRNNLTKQAVSFAELATEPIGKTFLLYKDSGTTKIDQRVGQFTSLDSSITNVAVYGLDGKTIYRQNDSVLPTISTEQATSFHREFIYGSGGKLVAIVQPFLEDSGVHRYNILYLVSNSQIDQVIRSGVVTIIAIAVISLMSTGLLVFLAMNQYLLKPISHVSYAALEISSGKLDSNITVERNDEIGDLARSVNTMANSLKADITKLQEVDKLKTEFMMIASHNLRTPLTIINGYLDTLKGMKLSKEASAMVDTAAANSMWLGNLAENILTVAELEAGHKLTSKLEAIDLVSITSEIAQSANTLAAEHSLKFTYNAPKNNISVSATRQQLRIALWNVIDNAIKFTKSGGQITMSLSSNEQSALLSISDTGIGITPDEQSKLFTKFHRGTSTWQYDYEGTGIGLYISKLLIDEFNGNIHVNSTAGKGSTFTIELPLINNNVS